MSGDRVTTLCRAWAVTRADGTVLGFTDHDAPLTFEGITFRADSGLSAAMLVQTTGLAVDNTEAMGALTDAALSEADIAAGRYDGAEVRAWTVDWRAPEERRLLFRGTIGEIRREGGAFHAELRGLSEALNRPLGRVYQRDCDAAFGDARCGMEAEAYGFEGTVVSVAGERLTLSGLPDRPEGWFAQGRIEALTGAAAGLEGIVQGDAPEGELRAVTLWAPLGAPLAPGDRLRLTAGCDKRAETCARFGNLENFRGFPDLPPTDWLLRSPLKEDRPDGGSLRPSWRRSGGS